MTKKKAISTPLRSVPSISKEAALPTVSTNDTRVSGITCTLRTVPARRALRKVLSQIKKKCPRDFARLQKRLTAVHPGEWDNGTLGEARPATVEDDRLQTVYVAENQEPWALEATLAHELGHVCSTQSDLDRRTTEDNEWASEGAADWYAYKWGFGKLIARDRRTRDLHHHGWWPGQTFEWPSLDRKWMLRVRITRSFVYRVIRKTPLSKAQYARFVRS